MQEVASLRRGETVVYATVACRASADAIVLA
jgi:hypothetical protein